MNIVNVGYDSTNYYVLSDSRPRLLVDVGFPGTLPKLQHQCKRMGVVLTDIPYLLATHYHPDHAGLAQELKHIGIRLLVIDLQQDAIPVLGTYLKPENHYLPIDPRDNVVISADESRAFLARIGIAGEIVATPGHSDDSVSLILDDGSAFTGDLPLPFAMDDETLHVLEESWNRLRARGVRTLYPGHGPAGRRL